MDVTTRRTTAWQIGDETPRGTVDALRMARLALTERNRALKEKAS